MIHIFVPVRYHKDRLIVGEDLSLGKRISFIPEEISAQIDAAFGR
tara:strand:+ start:1069 stop:1203 length:135 start_codon:yes stop_codon:yes gene_type:complete